MRVLITGAQGFIGRYVVADWLRSSATVHVVGLGRSARNDESFTHPVTWQGRSLPAPLPPDLAELATDARYSYLQVDLTDTPLLTSVLGDTRPDVVVHLAASLRDEPPEDLVRTNIGAVVSLLEAVVGSGIPNPRLVMGSSGSVYGVVAGRGLPLSEEMPCAPIDPYSVCKRAGEDISRVLALRHGLDVVWARIFNPVGPGQDERHLCGRLGQQFAEVAAGVRKPEVTVGPLHTTRDYIDVRDTATALRVLALEGAPGGVYNVATGHETAGTEVFETLERITGIEVSKRTSPSATRAADLDRHVADMSKLEALQWSPRHDLESGLRGVLDYYTTHVAPDRKQSGPAPLTRLSTTLRPDRSVLCTVEVARGAVHDLPDRLEARFGGVRVAVLSDDRVHELYGQQLVDSLRTAGRQAEAVVVPEGEHTKSLEHLNEVVTALRDSGFDRRSVLVNLGGGTITDLGGLVAATYLRGVAYVNAPTTLLAQHDSGIGGKVAVNTPWAKNFIGAFHHPDAVICDPEVLVTLDDRDVRCGVAESIKVALCGAPGLFELLETSAEQILSKQVPALEELVCRSARHKIALLEPDPYEVDLRRVLNLGHTFGHALEVELSYDDLQHGEAVGYGLAVASLLAGDLGVCDEDDVARVLRLIERYGILPRVGAEQLHAARKRIDDVRLVRGGSLNYVLPTSVRTVTILPDIDDGAIRRAVDSLLALGMATSPR